MPTAPTSFDDPRPHRRPADEGDDHGAAEPADDRDDWPPPRRRSTGFGFWMAVLWTLLYFVVTQIVAGMVFGILHIGIALVPEIRKNGMDALQPDKLNAWMQSPDRGGRHPVRRRRHPGHRAGPELVTLPQEGRPVVEAADRPDPPAQPDPRRPGPDRDPRCLALGSAIDVPIQRYVPSLQDILKAIGIDMPGLEGTDEMLGKLIGQSPWALALFVVGVTPAICEEVFCRGFPGGGCRTATGPGRWS